MHPNLKAFMAAMGLSLLAASTAAAQGVPGGPPSSGLVRIPTYQEATQARLRSPEAREAAKRFTDLEATSLDLVRQIQALALKDGAAEDIAKERDLLRKRLEETVSEAFEARQKLQQVEVQELKQRLAKVEGGVEKRETHKEQIVESRIAELLGENQELRWDPAGATATTARPMVIRGGGSAHVQAVPMFPGDLAPALPAPPRGLEGVVLAVSDSDLLEVSLGSEDGLKKGHDLDVFRESTYLGRAEVVSTKPDRSVARIMQRNDQGSIREGDRVRTTSRLPASAPGTPSAGPAVPRGGSAPTFQPPAPGPAAPAGEAAAPGAAAIDPFAASPGASLGFPLQQQMLLSHLADTRKALIDTEHAIKQAGLALATAQRRRDADASREAQGALELARRHADRVQREYETQLRLLELNVQAAQAKLDSAERELTQLLRLRQSGAVTGAELESRRIARELAENELEYARTLFNLHREATASPDPKDETPEKTEVERIR